MGSRKTTRRHVLAGLPFLPMVSPQLGPKPQIELRFFPESPATRTAVQSLGGRIAFTGAGSERIMPIDLPGADVALLGRLSLAGREILLASFSSNVAQTESYLQTVAVIGWDNARLRILAIEPEMVRTAEGVDLSLRLAASAADPILRLTYELSAPRGPTLPFHLQWIDMLSFHPTAPLIDIATRSPLAGSCQAELATIRSRMIQMLKIQSTSVSWSDLSKTGLLDFPRKLALATGRAAYPADMANP